MDNTVARSMPTAISNFTANNGESRDSLLQRGFTLIELLVVLVIISMFSGMIVLSIGDNFSRELRSEAERFQRLIIAASDEAIFTSSQLGVVIDKHQYSLARFDTVSQSWQPFIGQAFRLHSLPESMQLSLSIEGFSRPGSDAAPQAVNFGGSRSSDLTENNENDQSNGLYSFEADSSDGGNEGLELNIMPQILMLSSGEVTVFSLEFSAVEDVTNNAVIAVISDGFSSPSIKSISDNSNN